ncbi:hypothetical protein FIN98_03760 [Yersinia pestis]|nr:hypothetical protein FIN98_03760 [Yersinia pestis]
MHCSFAKFTRSSYGRFFCSFIPSIAAFILSFTDSYARSLYEFFSITRLRYPFSHYHLESLPLTIIFGHSHHC